MTITEQMLSPLPGDVLTGLRRADQMWSAYKKGEIEVPRAVHSTEDSLATSLEQVDWDVAIAGGTLGILLGASLAQKGWRVVVLERGSLRGRDQEWNISRRELQVFVDLHLLTADELEEAIATTYNPARLSFHKGAEFWVEDVLNVGVDPVYLLDTLKQKFLNAGGCLLENTAFRSATIHANGVAIQTGNKEEPLITTRLLVDAMGHFSPIARQARKGQKPEAVCLVVGTCAEGYAADVEGDRPSADLSTDVSTGDLFASITPIQNHCQYFWEAFPARDGRTTYLFTYLDAHPERPSLEDLFEDYWRLLPDYQGISLEQLTLKRALFGFFPCYRQGPLQLPWNRMLAVGDSSGSQSPLSFGGFGAMIRHLERLTRGVHEALEIDVLKQDDLAKLQPYQPNLSITWLFQRSMSVGLHQNPDPQQINALLSGVFEAMNHLGDSTLKPFLQDVIQFRALTQTLLQTTLTFPLLGLKIVPYVGLMAMLEWVVHYVNLGLYSGQARLGTATYPMLKPFIQDLPPKFRYTFSRWLDAWIYGSGGDYHG
ncbi:MAG: hypothetical protein WBA57_27655 [Elainellaceae cyanobacterium]